MKFRVMVIGWILAAMYAGSAWAVTRSDSVTLSGDTLVVSLEVEGVVIGTFDSVDGMDSETEVIEFQDGNDLLLLKRPGRVRYTNIILTKGELLSDALWDWYQGVVSGVFQRKNGSVIIRTRNGQEIVRYNFYNGWPCVWKGLSLGTGDAGDLVEEIQIAVDRMERRRPGAMTVAPVRKTLK